MSNYATNLGKQHVSIFPYQSLDSVRGNHILHKLMEPGVFNASVSVETSGVNVIFNIGAGSTFVFHRNSPLEGDLYDMTSKIVLGEDASFSIPITTLWGTEPPFSTANEIYIMADWLYDKNNAPDKFVQFYPLATLPTASIDTTDPTHKLLVATLLNHQEAITQQDVAPYRIAYQSQKGRSYLAPLYNRSNEFPIEFAYNGESISIGEGEVFVGNKLFRNLAPINMQRAPIISTVYDRVTGEQTTIAPGGMSLYNQIDFLRISRSEIDSSVALRWDSFLALKGTYTFDFVNYNIIKTQLKSYIAEQDFILKEQGMILLIAVRDTTGTVQLWPTNTLVFYEDRELLSSFITPFTDRNTIAMYASSDIIGVGQ